MNTLSLLAEARRIADDDATGFTHVWVVYDKDSFPAGDFNAVVETCRHEHSGRTEFHAVWSNECFELWYILHFEFMHAALSRAAYGPKLTKHLQAIDKGTYRKNRQDMFEILENRLDNAMENAYKLEQLNTGKTPTASNPGTNVHELIRYLRPYFGKEQ